MYITSKLTFEIKKNLITKKYILYIYYNNSKLLTLDADEIIKKKFFKKSYHFNLKNKKIKNLLKQINHENLTIEYNFTECFFLFLKENNINEFHLINSNTLFHEDIVINMNDNYVYKNNYAQINFYFINKDFWNNKNKIKIKLKDNSIENINFNLNYLQKEKIEVIEPLFDFQVNILSSLELNINDSFIIDLINFNSLNKIIKIKTNVCIIDKITNNPELKVLNIDIKIENKNRFKLFFFNIVYYFDNIKKQNIKYTIFVNVPKEEKNYLFIEEICNFIMKVINSSINYSKKEFLQKVLTMYKKYIKNNIEIEEELLPKEIQSMTEFKKLKNKTINKIKNI